MLQNTDFFYCKCQSCDSMKYKFSNQFLFNRILMSNLQDIIKSDSVHSIGCVLLHQNHFDYFSNGPTVENQSTNQSSLTNSIYTNAFEEAVDSFRTISHGSLEMVPEICAMDLHIGKQDVPLICLKSSQNSLIFYEQFEDDDQKQDKLIVKAQELNLKSSIEDQLEQLHKTNDGKNHRNGSMVFRTKSRVIRTVKLLVRQLKRQAKYNEEIMVDILIQSDQFKLCLKHATVRPIADEKGHLSGLIVMKDHEEYKIRVLNMGIDSYESKMQLWDEVKQSWLQFQFKIRLIF